MSSIGCGFGSGSGPGYAFWCTAASTPLRRHISPTASVEPLTMPLFSLGHVGRNTDEPFNTRRPCIPSGCIRNAQWLSQSEPLRHSGTGDLSLPVEFSLTNLGRSLIISGTVGYRACCILVDILKCPAPATTT